MADHLKAFLDESFERNADRSAIRVLRQSEQKGDRGLRYAPMTYRQLAEQRNRLVIGLSGQGLEKGTRVGILTDGGLEPILIFLACDALGLSSVPLCNKLSDDVLAHELNLSRPALLFVDPKSIEQIERMSDKLESLPRLVITEGQHENATPFFDLIKKSGDLPDANLDPDDESKVVFTSGSSGMPKGVVQTHRNILDNCLSIWDAISPQDDLVFFKSAPDYHTMGILNIYYPLAKGWCLDLARSPDRVLIDIRHSEPEGFLTVPLILDKVYGNVRKAIDAGGVRGKLVARSVRAKQKLARKTGSPMDWFVYNTIGKKVIRQIRERLASRVGPRLKLLIVGSAKADPEALDFFQDVLDITSFEGYGVTECGPLIAANSLSGQKSGSVGRPLLEVKVVTEAGEEIGYGDPATATYRSSGAQSGELWVHGTHVMREYLDDREQTEKVIVVDDVGNRWYRTGDLFSIDEEGFLTFAGRLGRQFKLRNGEFVNPELLERVYSAVPVVDHVIVVGDQQRDFPLPLVNVNVEELRATPGLEGLPQDDDAVRRHLLVAECVREMFLAEATRAGLPSHERPQRIVVLPEPLSEETGTLTRGLKKVVPKAIASKFEDLITAAYAS
jgi:long-chain acyl-CoA synthetase